VSAPTQAHACVRFRHGDRLVYTAAWPESRDATHQPSKRIIGPEGTIVMDSDFQFTWRRAPERQRVHCWDREKLRPEGLGGSWLFYKQLDSFVRDTGAPSLATGEESLASLWMAERIIDAGPDGRVFRFR